MSFAQHLFRPGFASFRSRVSPVRLASLSFARTKNLLCSMPCFRIELVSLVLFGRIWYTGCNPTERSCGYAGFAPCRRSAGGYSLAGLFSLWSAAQVDDFAAVAAVSPSVWFPGWADYADAHPVLARAAYLSLGDREEKSRNPVLASVGDAIRREDARLSERGVRHTLQWNVGNHFQDAEKRCADGFAWCMAQRKAEGKNT